MAGWWSIEVLHGEFSARRWQDTYSNALIESAVSHGAIDWEWHEPGAGEPAQAGAL